MRRLGARSLGPWSRRGVAFEAACPLVVRAFLAWHPSTPPPMRSSLLALSLFAASCCVDDLHAGGREPGSLLIYPVHHSGGGLFTVITVTNTSLMPASVGTLGGTTNAHFYYTNVVPDPADPFRPLNCTVFDRVEPLTPADTLTVLTECHNLGFGLQRQMGYLAVVAEDPTQFETAWSHNYLIGSSLVLSATGFAYRLEALTFQSPAPHGAATDVDADGRRDFDGVEYEMLPDRLYLDSFLAEADPQLALLNLTGDLADVHMVLFSVWNDYEMPLSATVSFHCWFETRLARINTLFDPVFLAGMPNDPEEVDTNCDGVDDLTSGWFLLQSLGVRTPGGQLIAADGALLGALTAGTTSICDPRRQLGESAAKQANGSLNH